MKKSEVGASFKPGYKQLAAAVAETGVDDYREIVKKVKKRLIMHGLGIRIYK